MFEERRQGAGSCDPALIESQLSKILASREFVRSDRMARFLRHIIECKIEGKAEELKERSIGIEVFDRSVDWDPKVDNIVRSEARRLRSKLEQYYANSTGDAVIISMPKGAYAPEFEVTAASSAPSSEAAPFVPPPRAHRFPLYRFVFVFGFMAIAALGLVRLIGGGQTTVQAGLAEVRPFANEIGAEISPAISPDGKWIAYAWDGNGSNYDIYLKPSDGGPDVAPKRLTAGPEPELYPAWSPDNRTLAFLRIGATGVNIILKDVKDGSEQVLIGLTKRPSGWIGENELYMDIGPSWTPDGRSLMVSDGAADQAGHAIYRISLDDRQPKAVLKTERGAVDYFPRISPNGRELAFARYISHGVSDLYLCRIDGSSLRRLTFDRRGVSGLAWAADGNSLYYTSWRHGTSRIWNIRTAPGSQAEQLPDSEVATGIAMGRGGGWIAFASVSENWNIWRMPLEETPARIKLGPPARFIASSGRNHGPSFSPDGKKLAFISDRTGSWQIWLADPDGGHPRQLSRFDGNFLGSVNWTPNSKMIAFDARPSGNSNIYLLDASKGGVPVPMAANHFEERMPSWSADGESVFFNSNRDGMVAVWRRSVATGAARKVGIESSFKSLEDASGKALFYSVSGGAVYRAAPDGSWAQPLSGVIASPEINWAVNGDTLYYTVQEQSGEVAFYAFRNGAVTLLTRFRGQVVQNTSNLAISPGAKWLLFAQLDHSTSDIVVSKLRDLRKR